MDELIARRDECKFTDSYIKRVDIDIKVLEKAKEAEKKLKRLRMAKYSLDLFDEIVEEMLKDKRS